MALRAPLRLFPPRNFPVIPPFQSASRLEALSRDDLLKEIQRMERYRADFLILLAHEIRDPLWPMRNGVDLLRRKGDDRPIREQAVEMMERQVDRLRLLAEG